jgi:hypothetical protein
VTRFTKKTRFIALFVLAFICLNAAGALCVAYCRSLGDNAAEIETASHCTRSRQTGPSIAESSVESANVESCPMFVVFAAPIGKPTLSGKTVARIALTELPFVELVEPFKYSDLSSVNYRGPPPLDRRPDRIKHRVILI